MAGTLGAAITTAPFVSSAADGSSLLLIEKKLITSNSTSTTFSGLNGDNDEVYYFTARVINNGVSQAKMSLKPNNLATSQFAVTLRFDDTGTFTSSESTFLTLRINSGAPGMTQAVIYAKATSNAIGFQRWGWASASQVNEGIWTSWRYTDTSTNITSLVFESDVADGLGNGSELVLYKLAQS